MNQGQQRIPCPQCRANNFPGNTNCWQCRAPLPPPESAFPTAAPSAPPNTAVPASQPSTLNSQLRPPGSAAMFSLPGQPRGGGFNWWYLRIALLAITLIGALAAATFYARLGRTATGLDANTQKAIDQIEAMNRSMEKMINNSQSPSVSSPGALDPNSLEGQARREMERLQRQHGINNPPLGPDGRVQLQTGGSLTPEEYGRARGALQNP